MTDRNVHFGKDGVLFLVGGNHAVLDYFSGKLTPPASSITTLMHNIDNRKRFCSSRGLEAATFVFPDKLYALREYLLLDLEIISLFLAHYAEAAVGRNLHYLISAVGSDRESFLDRDTHNSGRGCRRLAAEILLQASPDRVSLFERALDEVTLVKRTYRGDLGRKIEDGATAISETFNFSTTAIVSTDNGVLSGNEHAPAGRLLVFGDSFFRQLVPFFNLAFRTVMFCRSRYFHAELIDAFSPDAVFCGTAERYLSKCFLDQGRPHFLAYPILSGRATQPSEVYCQLWEKHIDSRTLAAVTASSGSF